MSKENEATSSYESSFERLLHPIKMTPSGRPFLLDGESELLTKPAVSLFDSSQGEKERCRIEDGSATITTHRILFIDPNSQLSIALWKISKVKAHPDGRWKSSSKIQLWGLDHGQSFRNDSPDAVLSIKSGRDEFLACLESSKKREAWISLSASEVVAKLSKNSSETFGQTAGIAGILRRQELQRSTTSQIASEAFSDLNSLILKAKEVVAVIERYQAVQLTSTSSNEDKNNDDSELCNALMDIGIVSPVTKLTAGSQYHQQLARQLADFLGATRGILHRFGGMMTLVDVYAVFNRARGTELISPQDLRTVSELLAPLKLGMSLRKFPSGVAVIQVDAFDERAMSNKIFEMSKKEPITFPSAAISLRISLVLAQEHVLSAEQAGLICRDETMEGIKFFPNLFPTF